MFHFIDYKDIDRSNLIHYSQETEERGHLEEFLELSNKSGRVFKYLGEHQSIWNMHVEPFVSSKTKNISTVS